MLIPQMGLVRFTFDGLSMVLPLDSLAGKKMLYSAGDLTIAPISQMTSDDASAAAFSNSVNVYGVW